ncbi:MAG: 16S rRNA (cytosine(1402)-N(4))-methyltransferase RsmH [Pseudomonadota bacterium]
MKHVPVLLDEVLAGLAVQPDGFYVDATFGRGGHAAAILRSLSPTGRLLALDRDPAAIEASAALANDSRFDIVQAPFSALGDVVRKMGREGSVQGILMDLGVSSPQLDDSRRGFSFMRDGPLDMRMDPGSGVSAAEWLATATEREIAGVLKTHGEERFARRIARAIVTARAERPLATTSELVAVITEAMPVHERHKHPATRSFQALRIHVNQELEELKAALAQIPSLLTAGGRLCVISFHSLEDRIVKRFMRDASRVAPEFAGFPVIPDSAQPVLKLVGKARRGTDEEVDANPRARSAILRVAEKLDGGAVR